MTRLIITYVVQVDVDLEEFTAGEEFTAEEVASWTPEEIAQTYAGVLGGFCENEIANCVEMPGHAWFDVQSIATTPTPQEA